MKRTIVRFSDNGPGGAWGRTAVVAKQAQRLAWLRTQTLQFYELLSTQQLRPCSLNLIQPPLVCSAANTAVTPQGSQGTESAFSPRLSLTVSHADLLQAHSRLGLSRLRLSLTPALATYAQCNSKGICESEYMSETIRLRGENIGNDFHALG